MFKITRCKTKGGISVKPVTNIKPDFEKIKQRYIVLFESPVALLVKIDDCEVVVHKYGELLFKTCVDWSKLKGVAEKIYK